MTKNTVIDDAKSMASTLRSVRMMRPAEAIEKLIEAYLAQEARIAALSKDAEPINESLAEDIECIDTRYRGDPNYEHDAYYMRNAAANLVRSGYKLYTHPPAPKAITADMVTDEMIDLVETTTTGAGAWDMVKPKELIAAAVNAFNGVKP